MKTITAADIMATRLHTLAPSTFVSEAMELFLDEKISGAPVVEDGRLVGVLSEKDCMRFLVDGLMTNAPEATVDQLMTRDVKTILPSTPLMAIAQLFQRSSFRRLPVLEGGQLLGQISRRDVLQAMHELHCKLGAQPTEHGSKHEATTRQGSMITDAGAHKPDVVGPETNKRFQ